MLHWMIDRRLYEADRHVERVPGAPYRRPGWMVDLERRLAIARANDPAAWQSQTVQPSQGNRA